MDRAMYSLVFPGQGSQSVGMASDFCAQFPESRAVLAEADEALGLPLAKWIAEGPDERLRPTAIQQPAILATAIAMLRALESRVPLAPASVAGHSLGEYTALVAAGALSLADAVRLVHRRGEFMQEAVPAGEGSMSAILGLSGDEVTRVCAGLASTVSPANFNSPVQTVIAGRSADVEAAEKALLEAGAKRAVRLEVSAPFHCALMRMAMEKLAPLLAEAPFARARCPVVSNVTAAPYQEANEARELLRQQVCAPVRWIECVQRMAAGGSKLLVEVGPGAVLSGLTARIDRGLGRANLATVEDLAKVEAALAGGTA
jgi:[acyl-carrier-protein] S-malonyltransferase